jgi:hypothetical protein
MRLQLTTFNLQRFNLVRASSGAYYTYEQKYFPRAETWDLLLKRTGAPGIHFDDYPQLQGYPLPEGSHIAASDAVRFTAALVPIVEREFTASRKEVFLGEHVTVNIESVWYKHDGIAMDAIGD